MSTTALHLAPSAPIRRTRRAVSSFVTGSGATVRAGLAARAARRTDARPGVDHHATPSQIALRSVTRHEPLR